MSLKEVVGKITDRFNNAKFEDPKRRQEVAEGLRKRIGNALEGQQRKEDSDGSAQTHEVNYRGLANRVINSTLSDEDKRHLLHRIKNAASGGGSDQGSGSDKPTAIAEAIEPVSATSTSGGGSFDGDVKEEPQEDRRGEIERRRLLAKA